MRAKVGCSTQVILTIQIEQNYFDQHEKGSSSTEVVFDKKFTSCWALSKLKKSNIITLGDNVWHV